MSESHHRVQWYTDRRHINWDPHYRVTRALRLVGLWPFRRTEHTYYASTEFSTITMTADAYVWFKAAFGGRITEEFDE